MQNSQNEAGGGRRWLGRRLLALAGATALVAAGGIVASLPAAAVDGGLSVTSSDMTDGTGLNPMFACAAGGPVPTGGQISPELAVDFSSMATPPAAFAIVMHDEFGANAGYDAPGDWVHWISYNMTPGTGVTEVPRNASQTDTLLGGTEGLNSWNETGYRGPCPPPGGTHNYYFTVYALDAAIAPANQSPLAILAAMQGHILDQGDLQVTFATPQIGTSAALVELEFGSSMATEDAGAVTLPRLLVNGVVTAPSTATLEINATGCVHAPATSPGDYTYSGGTTTINVPIPAGTYDGRVGTAVAIPGVLSLVNDLTVEPIECLAIELMSVTGPGVSIGDAGHTDPIGAGSAHPGVTQTTWTLEIQDDDLGGGLPLPTIEFAAATASGTETAGGALPSLLVNGVVLAPFDVTLTVAGTATAGTDFSAPTTVTIPAGLYDGTVATAVAIPGFAVVNDTIDEPDETVIVTVSADAADAIIGDANLDTTSQSSTVFTILDDDLPIPTIEFAAATGSTPEGVGGQLPLLLVNGTLPSPVQVTVGVTGGTANGADFTAPTTVTIPAGTYDGTAATGVLIPGFTVTDDAVVEPDETAVFSLTSANAALLAVGDANGNGTTVAVLTFTITNDDTAPSPSPSPAPTGSASGSGSLAATGGELGSSLLIGLGLLLVGGLVAVLRRARKA